MDLHTTSIESDIAFYGFKGNERDALRLRPLLEIAHQQLNHAETGEGKPIPLDLQGPSARSQSSNLENW